MTHEQEQHFNRLAEDIKTIKHALVGNPLLEDGGLVKRMSQMDGRQDGFETDLKALSELTTRWKWFAAGASAAATLVGWIVNLLWF